MKKMMFNKEYGLERAVLLGGKDLTRRDGSKVILQYRIGLDVRYDKDGKRESLIDYAIRKSPFKVGDVVAIAQSYKDAGYEPGRNIPLKERGGLQVRADSLAGWSNKMFVRPELMPHRIEITGIRFEQLQCISDEDCFREGIYSRTDVIDTQMRDVVRYQYANSPLMFKTPREAFASLIDELSGRGTWERNGFVYVYSFKLKD